MELFDLTQVERDALQTAITQPPDTFDGVRALNAKIAAITQRVHSLYEAGQGMNSDDLNLIDLATSVLSEVEDILQGLTHSTRHLVSDLKMLQIPPSNSKQ